MEKIIFNLGDLLNKIKYPSITEKSMNLYEQSQYTFIVDRSLTKTQIKYILEKVFDVTVTSVNTNIFPVKTRRVGKFIGKRSCYKKAYIKLKEGDSIANIFN